MGSPSAAAQTTCSGKAGFSVDNDSIRHLQAHLNSCLRARDYKRAGELEAHLQQLKEFQEQHALQVLSSQQARERLEQDEAYATSQQELLDSWQIRIQDLQDQLQQAQQQLLLRQQNETATLLAAQAAIPARPKFTPLVLNMRKIEHNLAGLKEFAKAERVKHQAEQQEALELQCMGTGRRSRQEAEQAALVARHTKEQQAAAKKAESALLAAHQCQQQELEQLARKHQASQLSLSRAHAAQHLKAATSLRGTLGLAKPSKLLGLTSLSTSIAATQDLEAILHPSAPAISNKPGPLFQDTLPPPPALLAPRQQCPLVMMSSGAPVGLEGQLLHRPATSVGFSYHRHGSYDNGSSGSNIGGRSNQERLPPGTWPGQAASPLGMRAASPPSRLGMRPCALGAAHCSNGSSSLHARPLVPSTAAHRALQGFASPDRAQHESISSNSMSNVGQPPARGSTAPAGAVRQPGVPVSALVQQQQQQHPTQPAAAPALNKLRTPLEDAKGAESVLLPYSADWCQGEVFQHAQHKSSSSSSSPRQTSQSGCCGGRLTPLSMSSSAVAAGLSQDPLDPPVVAELAVPGSPSLSSLPAQLTSHTVSSSALGGPASQDCSSLGEGSNSALQVLPSSTAAAAADTAVHCGGEDRDNPVKQEGSTLSNHSGSGVVDASTASGGRGNNRSSCGSSTRSSGNGSKHSSSDGPGEGLRREPTSSHTGQDGVAASAATAATSDVAAEQSREEHVLQENPAASPPVPDAVSRDESQPAHVVPNVFAQPPEHDAQNGINQLQTATSVAAIVPSDEPQLLPAEASKAAEVVTNDAELPAAGD